MNQKKIGLYIHIPFCKQKCRYCDFKSYAGKEGLVEEYISCLLNELKQIGEGNKKDYKEQRDDLIVIDTIYIGGGTPSFIDSKYIVSIIETIKKYYTVISDPEITIEINPGTVTRQKVEDYFDCGINRISIGLQSINQILLKQLGRIHNFQEFLDAYYTIRQVGFKNINVDLMIGLPNQTIKDVQESIEMLEEMNAEHISVYSLIVEEETPLYQDIKDEKLILPSDELEREMYWFVKNELEEKGYNHYEISNFAKPGLISKHNIHCWNQEEYIGVGVSAHSYTNHVRYSNIDSIEQYIQNNKENKTSDNFIFHEKQNKESQMKEYMMLGLRMIKGIQIQEFKRKFGENPICQYNKELKKLVEEDLIEIDGDDIKLTNKGIDLANLVWEEFV